MKNWLKNNKYKIIILPLVLLLGIFIGGCTNDSAGADYDGPLQDVNDTSSLFLHDSYVMVDKKTHVEYLVAESYDDRGGVSITPRLNSDGKPMIKH